MIQKIENQTIEEKKKDDLLRVSSIETLELDEVSDILSESENNQTKYKLVLFNFKSRGPN